MLLEELGEEDFHFEADTVNENRLCIISDKIDFNLSQVLIWI